MKTNLRSVHHRRPSEFLTWTLLLSYKHPILTAYGPLVVHDTSLPTEEIGPGSLVFCCNKNHQTIIQWFLAGDEGISAYFQANQLHPQKPTWTPKMKVWFRCFSFSNGWFSGSSRSFSGELSDNFILVKKKRSFHPCKPWVEPPTFRTDAWWAMSLRITGFQRLCTEWMTGFTPPDFFSILKPKIGSLGRWFSFGPKGHFQVPC